MKKRQKHQTNGENDCGIKWTTQIAKKSVHQSWVFFMKLLTSYNQV